METLISIIIPVYNVEKYLTQCMNSVINQTLANIEIICVNDGSKDSSLKILEEFAKKDNRITIISKENKGYGHSINMGMQKAKGEYIAILESDDYIKDNMYETLYYKAKEYNLDVVKANCIKFYLNDENQEVMIKSQIINELELYNKVISYKNAPISTHIPYMSWSGIYKKEFLLDNKIWHNETPGASYQDVGFCTLTTIMASRLMYIEDFLYRYRIDNPNSSVKDGKKINCVFEENEFIKNYLEERNLYSLYKERFTYTLIWNYLSNLIRFDQSLVPKVVEKLHLYIKTAINNNSYTDKWFTLTEKKLVDKILCNSKEATLEILKKNKSILEKRNKVISIIKNSRGVAIYGAGIWGDYLFEHLVYLHLVHKINCFCTTNNPNKIEHKGLSLKSINEIEDKNILLIIAVSPIKNMQTAIEMKNYAISIGFNNIKMISEIMDI